MGKMRDLIRELNSRIDIPQPHRSDLICEIYYDMKETYDHYTEKGLSTEEAENRTCEKFSFDDASLKELSDLHCSGYCKMLNRFSGSLRNRMDKSIMVITVLFILLVYFSQISSTELFKNAGEIIFLPLAITSAALLILAAKVMQLYIRKEHSIKTLKRGSGTVIFCSIFSLMTGISGYFLQFYKVTVQASKEIEIYGYSTDILIKALVEWHLKGTALLIFSVFSSILIAILWLVIVKKESMIIDREADLIINDPFI